MKCACRTETFEGAPAWFQCPLCKAAPGMYAACKAVEAFLDSLGTDDPNDPLHAIRMRTHAPLYAKLRPAIAKAEAPPEADERHISGCCCADCQDAELTTEND